MARSKEKRNAAETLRRNRAREEGLCITCGKPRDGHSVSRCNKCQEANRSARQAIVSQGRCPSCGGSKENGKGLCDNCSSIRKTRESERREQFLGAGLCSSCGKDPAVDGFISCEACLNRGRLKHRRLRLAAINEYGGPVCSCCGETNIEFLQIDHVEGNGGKHRNEINSNTIYRWLKRNKFPPGFQVLCANCNFSKGAYGYCPHQVKRPPFDQ